MTTTRLSIFPLAGALLFPRMHLPLHIFEPRYCAMVSDAMARDRRIGMIQPRGDGEPPPLFDLGCVGRIAEVEALKGCAQIADLLDDRIEDVLLPGPGHNAVVDELLHLRAKPDLPIILAHDLLLL